MAVARSASTPSVRASTTGIPAASASRCDHVGRRSSPVPSAGASSWQGWPAPAPHGPLALAEHEGGGHGVDLGVEDRLARRPPQPVEATEHRPRRGGRRLHRGSRGATGAGRARPARRRAGPGGGPGPGTPRRHRRRGRLRAPSGPGAWWRAASWLRNGGLPTTTSNALPVDHARGRRRRRMVASGPSRRLASAAVAASRSMPTNAARSRPELAPKRRSMRAAAAARKRPSPQAGSSTRRPAAVVLVASTGSRTTSRRCSTSQCGVAHAPRALRSSSGAARSTPA